ncbi:hypothetical protein E3U55_12750 [Filobacillus milosensis]|uniref:Uncharacterized protein n=1 Tax=Filobacillus milosensis TaxID=94137 RepID=A0A4Y8IF28_9BACI|nr:hypothetical protein [Filobacillus milosensis]TFB14760.1 hypothetical protein E3U55_12750 [Filobacillus milosensis]
MLGLMITEQEQKEIEYLLKREMDELLYDFNYQDMDKQVKEAIKERYSILFNIFRRMANHSSCLNYTPKKNFPRVK